MTLFFSKKLSDIQIILKTIKIYIKYMRSLKWRSIKKYFIRAVILSAVLAPIYLFFNCKTQDWLTAVMTYFLAVTTAAVIWWQGRQLKMQLELQVLTELFKEWNSLEMKESRAKSLDDDNSDLDTKEYILEFLERIASYYLHRVLSEKLIWDTIGWYVLRYYFYYHEAKVIDKIRSKWGNDNTLYADIGKLYNDLANIDICKRKITMEKMEKDLRKEKDKFKESEKE